MYGFRACSILVYIFVGKVFPHYVGVENAWPAERNFLSKSSLLLNLKCNSKHALVCIRRTEQNFITKQTAPVAGD